MTMTPRSNSRCRALFKHPGLVPVEVVHEQGSSDKKLGTYKYLVQPDMSMGQFMSMLRARLKIDATEGVFLMVGDVLAKNSSTMQDLYALHQDSDNILVITVAKERVFGFTDT